MTVPLVALLGRKDEPTDAVEEYCQYLGAALAKHGFQTEMRRVPWEKHGWPNSLEALKLQAADWRGRWVLLQYTALAWSGRGFPGRVLSAVRILRAAGARIAIIFHDVEPYPGDRLVDRFRRAAQLRTMRALVGWSDCSIFTVPLEKISWLPQNSTNVQFVPVGANLPVDEVDVAAPRISGRLTVGVFSITGGTAGEREVSEIVPAVQFAATQLGPLALRVFGRNADQFRARFRNELSGSPVEISINGVVSPEDAVKNLRGSDVLLFVRGAISSRRSSALAGICCGLPVIAHPGSETASPITEAGVVLVPPGDQSALNHALTRVLRDSAFRADLAARSNSAWLHYFSWEAIAEKMAAILT